MCVGVCGCVCVSACVCGCVCVCVGCVGSQERTKGELKASEKQAKSCPKQAESKLKAS